MIRARMWHALICATAILIGAMAATAPASDGYVRFSCGGNGISSLLATANGRGETLLAWQDGRQSADQFCESAVADAAIASTGTGFANLGTVSAPGPLSYATGVSLDDAGDGWVVGLHEVFAEFQQYGPVFEKSGAWAAFRPAGGSFRTPIELPTKGGPPQAAWVASNPTGRTLLAWSTYAGTYLALATTTGTITKPTYIGHGFQVSDLNIDENGRALVVGYYGTKKYEAIKIATVTANTSGSFSQPHTLVHQPHNKRKKLTGYLSPPIVAIGPRGNAIIAWESSWVKLHNENDEFKGPNLLIHRKANGHYDRPARLPKGFLSEDSTAAVDRAGRAIIVSPTSHGLAQIAIAPNGRTGPQRHLSKYGEYPRVATNALGQTAITWGIVLSPLKVILGDTRGAHGEIKPTAPTPTGVSDGEATVTVDPQGIATVFWIEERKREERVLNAQAITSGAQPIEIAGSGPAGS